MNKITIVGMGTGNTEHLTLQAQSILSSCEHIYARTLHPPYDQLIPKHCKVTSFDEEYSRRKVPAVYYYIAEKLLEVARTTPYTVYAVPGNPMFGEFTVQLLTKLALQVNVEIEIVQGISFIDAALTALRVDPLNGLDIVSAEEIAISNIPNINSAHALIITMAIWPLKPAHLYTSLKNIYPLTHPVKLLEKAGLQDETLSEFVLRDLEHHGRPHPLSCYFLPPIQDGATFLTLLNHISDLPLPDINIDIETTSHMLISNLAHLRSQKFLLNDVLSATKKHLSMNSDIERGRLDWSRIEQLLGKVIIDNNFRNQITIDLEVAIQGFNLSALERLYTKAIIEDLLLGLSND